MLMSRKLHLSSPSEKGNNAGIDYVTILAGFRNLRRLAVWMKPRDIMKFMLKALARHSHHSSTSYRLPLRKSQ